MGEEPMVIQEMAEGARLVSYLDAAGLPSPQRFWPMTPGLTCGA